MLRNVVRTALFPGNKLINPWLYKAYGEIPSALIRTALGLRPHAVRDKHLEYIPRMPPKAMEAYTSCVSGIMIINKHC